MSVKIRRAEAADIDRLIELLRQICNLHHKQRPDIFKKNATKYTSDELEKMLKEGRESHPVFVAVDKQNTVRGYCFCRLIEYENHAVINNCRLLFIDDVCVDENCRGRGIGKKLFEAVREYAERSGVDGIELNVWNCNQIAVDFYKSCGFVPKTQKMELIF